MTMAVAGSTVWMAQPVWGQELAKELAKFQSEQVLKNVQKLPRSTEQKLELVDAASKHLKAQK